MSAEKRACTTSRKKSRTLSTPTRPFQPEDIEAALAPTAQDVLPSSQRPSSPKLQSRDGRRPTRPSPFISRSTYRGDGQDPPHWCRSRSSHQRKLPKRPALPSQIDFATSSPLCRSALRSSFSRMLLRWRSLESSLGKPAHWHGPSPKTYAIQSNTRESSSDTRSRCAKGPLDPIVGGRDLGR